MKRKMLNVPKGGYDGMKGFTIVEFLVAETLAQYNCPDSGRIELLYIPEIK